MSVKYEAFAAVGFKVTAQEVAKLDQDIIDFFFDNEYLISLNEYEDSDTFLFVTPDRTRYADEGTSVDISCIWSSLTYKVLSNFIDMFNKYFPDEKEQQITVHLGCRIL